MRLLPPPLPCCACCACCWRRRARSASPSSMLAVAIASSCCRFIAGALPPAARLGPFRPPAGWPGLALWWLTPAEGSGRRSCSFRGSSLPFFWLDALALFLTPLLPGCRRVALAIWRSRRGWALGYMIDTELISLGRQLDRLRLEWRRFGAPSPKQPPTLLLPAGCEACVCSPRSRSLEGTWLSRWAPALGGPWPVAHPRWW